MPKLKTNRGATKRFRRSPNRIKCKHSHHNHILTKKVSKRKRHLRATTSVHASRQHEVVRLLTGT